MSDALINEQRSAMVMVTAPKKGEPCQKCGKRRSAVQFSEGGALAATHGFGLWWCWVCVFETQLKHARERAAAIPDLERKLAEAKAEAKAGHS